MNKDNLRNQMIALFNDMEEYALTFREKTYSDNVDELLKKYHNLFINLQQTIEESQEALEEAAAWIPDYALSKINGISAKKEKNALHTNYNLIMVSFFIPVIGEISSEKAVVFTQKIVEFWNERLPEPKIRCTSRSQVEEGFDRKLCYITTAVCKGLNKPDNCYELMTLRKYRDEYLLQSDGGQELVEEYYNIAPTIVKRISLDKDSSFIYESIYDNYLKPCIQMIEDNHLEECKDKYRSMVQQLERKYLYS